MGITAGTAALVVGVAGAAASAAGALSQAKYSSQVARNNATIAGQNSAYAAQAGNQAAQEASLQSAAQGAGLKADEAANGVDVNTGSAVNVQSSQRMAGTLDTDQVMHNALLQSYGYQSTVESENAQAKQDISAGDLQATGGLVQDASSLGFKWGGGGGGNDNLLPGDTGYAGSGGSFSAAQLAQHQGVV